MFSIFTYVMSRVTHSEPGLPMSILVCWKARVTFRVMKLGRCVIVDDSGNHVTFQKLNVRFKIKNNKSSQRELRPSVFQCDRFVQICLLLARPSFWSRNDTKLPKPWKNVVKFIEHALHVSKTCHVSLRNIHCFVLQTKHFHWPSRYSCLGNCLVW